MSLSRGFDFDLELIARGEGAGLTRPLLTANLTQSAEGTAPVKTPSTSFAHLSIDRAMIRNARSAADQCRFSSSGKREKSQRSQRFTSLPPDGSADHANEIAS